MENHCFLWKQSYFTSARILLLPWESNLTSISIERSNLNPRQDVSIIRINYEAFGRNVAEDSIRMEVRRDAFPRCTWIMHSDTLQCFEVGHVPFQRMLCIAAVTERTITTWKRQLQAVLNTDIHASRLVIRNCREVLQTAVEHGWSVPISS